MKLAPANEILERIGIVTCFIGVIVIILLLIWFVNWVLNMMSFKGEVEFDITALQEKCRHHDKLLNEIKDRLEEIKYHLNQKGIQKESPDYEALYLAAKEKADNWDKARWIIDENGRVLIKNEEGEITAVFTEDNWVFNKTSKTHICFADDVSCVDPEDF